MSTSEYVHKFGRVEAIRYGDVDGNWEEGATARIAQFVLGLDVKHVTTLNESLMRVLEPVDEFWNPEQGIADVVIVQNNGVRIALGLGQWLARYPSGTVRPMPHNDMVASFFPPPPEESFEVELQKLITKHGRERVSGTPSPILTDYILKSLNVLDGTIMSRSIYRDESIT